MYTVYYIYGIYTLSKPIFQHRYYSFFGRASSIYIHIYTSLTIESGVSKLQMMSDVSTTPRLKHQESRGAEWFLMVFESHPVSGSPAPLSLPPFVRRPKLRDSDMLFFIHGPRKDARIGAPDQTWFHGTWNRIEEWKAQRL